MCEGSPIFRLRDVGRRNRREEQPEPSEIRLGGLRRSETFADGDWIVQHITGSATTKTYRCPGCDMEIRPGSPHIVAWPDYLSGGDAAVEERRHWHTACWKRRAPSRGGR